MQFFLCRSFDEEHRTNNNKEHLKLYPRQITIKMILISSIVSSLIVVVIGECDACRNGKCLTKITLLQNVDITDQLATDWVNNILYVQLNSVLITAFYIRNFTITKMHVVQVLETSGMAIRHDTQDLYTADFRSNIYRIKKGTSKAEVVSNGLLDGIVNFMYYGSRLYVTKKNQKNLFHFYKSSFIPARDLSAYLITEFVKTKTGVIFVSNNTVYEYKRPFKRPPTVLNPKKMILSTDKNHDIYFASVTEKVILIKTNSTKKLLVYAAYKEGNVDKFVFDKHNNVIVHDAKAKTLSIWKEEGDSCKIIMPHCSIEITVDKPPVANEEEEPDDQNENDSIIYDFFWGKSEKLRDCRSISRPK